MRSSYNGPVWYMMEEKGDQGLQELSYDTELESWYTPVVGHCWPCQLKPTPFVGLINRDGEKAYARPTAAYPVPRDAQAMKRHLEQQLHWTHHLVETYHNPRSFKIPLVFCTRQIGELHGGVVRSLYIFQVLNGGCNVISASPQECDTVFGLLCFWAETILMASTWPFQP